MPNARFVYLLTNVKDLRIGTNIKERNDSTVLNRYPI
ncbi:unnamed protein product, partial [Candida parapsilosis]